MWSLLHWIKITHPSWVQKVQQVLESKERFSWSFYSISRKKSEGFCFLSSLYIHLVPFYIYVFFSLFLLFSFLLLFIFFSLCCFCLHVCSYKVATIVCIELCVINCWFKKKSNMQANMKTKNGKNLKLKALVDFKYIYTEINK